MIRRYIIWRKNHAHDERLRRVVERANVAGPGTEMIAGCPPGLACQLSAAISKISVGRAMAWPQPPAGSGRRRFSRLSGCRETCERGGS